MAIVIPAFNEEGKVGRVLSKIPAGIAERIIVVDDASTDATRKEALDGGAEVVSHAVNRGVGSALRTGMLHARTLGCSVVAILSGDDQHDPSQLSAVLEPVLAGRADFVQGSRRLVGGGINGAPLFRDVTTRLYAFLFRHFTGFPSTDATNGFRSFRLALLDDPNIAIEQAWLDSYELEPYLLYQAVSKGYRVVEVPVTISYHSRGTTKMVAVRDWWRILRPLVLLTLGLKR